jgi:hypothetical protein
MISGRLCHQVKEPFIHEPFYAVVHAVNVRYWSDRLAASITPARLELITVVGPPDWPITAFPFDHNQVLWCGLFEFSSLAEEDTVVI